jgi:hypothetical protein
MKLGLMQKASLACGSMVLYLFCLFFFARPGEKEQTKGEIGAVPTS